MSFLEDSIDQGNMDAEKNGLPPYSAVAGPPAQPWHQHGRPHLRRSRAVRLMALSFLAFIVYAQWRQIPASPAGDGNGESVSVNGLSVAKLQADLAVCSKLRAKPSDPIGLGRERNARYIDGHKPTLIRNATVWVGEPVEGTSAGAARAGEGWEWINADVFLEHGLIKQVGKDISVENLPKDTITWDAKGRQLTAGVIDMHSHSGKQLPGTSLTFQGGVSAILVSCFNCPTQSLRSGCSLSQAV